MKTQLAKSNGFKCKEGCHECCTLPPMRKQFLIDHQHLVKGVGIEVIEEGGYCYVLTADYICPFLQDNKCVVYNDRPKICRDYGIKSNYPCVYVDRKGRERTAIEQQRILNDWAEKRLQAHIKRQSLPVK